MADDGLLPDPGDLSGEFSSDLPDGSSLSGSNLPNLTPTYASSLLTPPSSMDDDLTDSTSDLGDSAYTGLPALSGQSNPLDLSAIFGDLNTDATSALGAFVVNPQNAKTAEAVANNAAANQLSLLNTQGAISLASSSNLFSYLLIGLAVFAVISVLGKK